MEHIILSICLIVTQIVQLMIIFRINGIEKGIQPNAQAPLKTPPKTKFKPLEQTDEQRQHNTLMSNIDNYNGTGQKQEKVR